uniref:Uncharacterized protein n=1 Tax=Arundo donax TaxID=35708 RepID=A0A0A9GMJ0_ARUDO
MHQHMFLGLQLSRLAWIALGYGKRLPRRPATDGRVVGAVVASLPSPLALLADHRRLALARLVHQDLLPPALLAAEPLVAPIHVDVLVGAELQPAEGAGLEEAARDAGKARRDGGARPHHLLQDYVRRVRLPAVVVVVVMLVMVHQDLEPHDEVLALPHAPGAAGHSRADEAGAVVGGATLLPEVEDALPSWEHGGDRGVGREHRLLTCGGDQTTGSRL